MQGLNGKGLRGNGMFSRVMEFKLWIRRIVKKALIDGKKCEGNELEILSEVREPSWWE